MNDNDGDASQVVSRIIKDMLFYFFISYIWSIFRALFDIAVFHFLSLTVKKFFFFHVYFIFYLERLLFGALCQWGKTQGPTAFQLRPPLYIEKHNHFIMWSRRKITLGYALTLTKVCRVLKRRIGNPVRSKKVKWKVVTKALIIFQVEF